MYINAKDQDDSEVAIMAVSYKKLWKLLIDRDLKRKIRRDGTGEPLYNEQNSPMEITSLPMCWGGSGKALG